MSQPLDFKRNVAMDLDLGLINSLKVNRNAADRRAASLANRRTVKKEYQAAWLVRALKQSHILVEHAPNARMGTAKLHDDDFDAVVLDLQLPDQHGFDWLTEARAAGCRLPVLILTAQGAVQDRIEGLHRGADDYLPNPLKSVS